MLIILFSCNKNNISSKSDKADYYKAYKFLDSKKRDSAFKYFNKAKDNFLKEDNFSFAGSCLVNMAIIQCEQGDYYGSQETALSAIQYLDKKRDALEIVSNYNNLGLTCEHLNDHKKAAQFYDKAAQFSTKPIDQQTLLNNRAVSLMYLKKYDSAINILNKILAFPNIKSHPIVFSKVYDNLAYIKFRKNPSYNAEPELKEAVQIRKSAKDNEGLNASYSHLTEYFEQHDLQKALYYAKENFNIASTNHSPDDQLKALKKIILLENPENIKPYFIKQQSLNDSLTAARNESKYQFAIERFGSEQLKRENAENLNHIFKQNAGLASLSLALIAGFFIYKRRKKILKQEKELEVKNTQLKMSKKVHDVVANGVYQIITEIENQDGLDKNRILYKLENVYEKSRDLSYENTKSNTEENFSERISNLLVSFQNENRKVFIVRNDRVIWDGLTGPTKEEVFHVIQELMINMKKHSQADQVVIRFERLENDVHIYYSDNGIGIAEEINPKNGMQNTENRIQAIQGKIIFDRQTEKGLKVNISFPIS